MVLTGVRSPAIASFVFFLFMIFEDGYINLLVVLRRDLGEC